MKLKKNNLYDNKRNKKKHSQSKNSLNSLKSAGLNKQQPSRTNSNQTSVSSNKNKKMKSPWPSHNSTIAKSQLENMPKSSGRSTHNKHAKKVGNPTSGIVSSFKNLKSGFSNAFTNLQDLNNNRRVNEVDDNGLNMIANMERNLYQINYDQETNKIISIPTTIFDVGYGHDIVQNKLENVPYSISAEKAFQYLYEDIKEFSKPIADLGTNLTQDQFNALVSLKYNVGHLEKIDGMIDYIKDGDYDRETMQQIVNNRYDDIIAKNPAKEQFREGWYNRTEQFLDVFFDGNYGDMPIDAVNGMVIKD